MMMKMRVRNHGLSFMSGWHNGYHILKALYSTIFLCKLSFTNYWLILLWDKLHDMSQKIESGSNFCNNDSYCFAVAVSLTLVQLISLYFCSSDPKPMRIIAHQQQNRSLYKQRSHTYAHHKSYSCMLSCLAFEWKWGWKWSCFDRNLTAFHV